MKKWTKIALVTLLGLVLMGGAVAVYAQQGNTPSQPLEASEPPPPEGLVQHEPPFPAQEELLPHRRPQRGLQGEVTAVHDSGLSILTRNAQIVEINVHSGTKIWLVETQSQGSLGDIQVGDDVLVEGCRCGETAVGARRILVGPDGDEIHGRVTAVEGTTIQLETREGSATVLTTDETEFRLRRQEASLEDVSEGVFLVAFGQPQSDGSLSADLAIIQPQPPRPPARNVRGEVTAVSTTGLTMLVLPQPDTDQEPVSVQVNVTDETKVWLIETESRGSLADIETGDKVVVRGTRAEGSMQDAPIFDAMHIAVGPDGDEVHGRVMSIDGTTFTLENRDGQTPIHTDAETSFRKDRQQASLEDVTEGTVIVAFGTLQSDGSLDADQVYIHHGPGGQGGPGAPRGGPDGPPPTGADSSPMPGARSSARQS